MKVVIMAPRGKMGKLITKAAYYHQGLEIVAGVAPPGSDYCGQDIGMVAGMGIEAGAPVVDDLSKVIDKCDLIIDFSTVETTMAVLEAAVQHGKAVACGTTGFSPEQWDKMRQAARQIPLLYGANTSRAVNLLSSILELVATKLAGEADIEIIEMHGRDKLDAPSGTSKELGQAIAKGLGQDWESIATFSRQGSGLRIPGTIGYHSVRAGDISSSHTVIFGLKGEQLEFTHHAFNWECFAEGACACAAFLDGKPAGWYTVQDVLR